MGKYEMVGEQKSLGKNPVSSPSADPPGGQSQMTGEEVTLGTNPVPSPSASPSSGAFDTVGEKCSLNRTPVKGWGSAANIPMSQRSVQQSQGKK
jgi:hypothetical protein